MSLRKSVLYTAVTAGLLGICPASAWAQEQPEAAVSEIPTAPKSAIGEVTATSVNVRSGPAESHYPTMKLNKGDRVVVVGHRFDWLKIKPPQGSFSYIAKIYVDRDGAGASGTVSRNDVVVRAGSTLSAQNSEVQTKLNTGDKVEILGEQNEYYKITPPEGAYLYVAKQFVSLVRPATTGEAVPTPAAVAPDTGAQPTTQAAAPAIPADTATPAQPVQPVQPRQPARQQQQPAQRDTEEVTQPPARTAAQAAEDAELQFRRIESRFQQAEAQKLEDRQIEPLLKEYREMQKADALTATSRRMVLYRIAQLESMQQQQAELNQAKQADAEFQAKQKELEAQRQEIQQRIQASAIQVYTAVGQLQASALQKDGQPLLRLVDPADGKTLIYVSSGDPKHGTLVGKFVGVKGNISRDERQGVEIIDPTDMVPVDQTKVLRGVTAKIYPPSSAKGQ